MSQQAGQHIKTRDQVSLKDQPRWGSQVLFMAVMYGINRLI